MSPAAADDGGLQGSEALQSSHRAFSAIILHKTDRSVQQHDRQDNDCVRDIADESRDERSRDQNQDRLAPPDSGDVPLRPKPSRVRDRT